MFSVDIKMVMELWINNKFSINTLLSNIWSRAAFHSNCPRWLDFGTYWLQRDGPMPYQSVFWIKGLLFWQTCPKVKFAVSSYFYSLKKLLILCVGPLFKKNRSDRASRVVYPSLCCMFHASLCTVQSGDFHFLAIGYLLG